jgi:hypothetical protein
VVQSVSPGGYFLTFSRVLMRGFRQQIGSLCLIAISSIVATAPGCGCPRTNLEIPSERSEATDSQAESQAPLAEIAPAEKASVERASSDPLAAEPAEVAASEPVSKDKTASTPKGDPAKDDKRKEQKQSQGQAESTGASGEQASAGTSGSSSSPGGKSGSGPASEQQASASSEAKSGAGEQNSGEPLEQAELPRKGKAKSNVAGVLPGKTAGKPPPPQPKGDPQAARRKGREGLAAANKAAADGDPAKAFKEALTGWQAVSPFKTDAECRRLAAELAKQLKQSGAAANAASADAATDTNKILVVE